MNLQIKLPEQNLSESGILELGDEFNFHCGAKSSTVSIAYQLVGDLSKPLIVLLGGISADRNFYSENGDGWWQQMLDKSEFFSSGSYSFLSFDYLGGCGDSTPAEALKQIPDFSGIDTRDQASALSFILDQLGIQKVEAVVGASYGGLVASRFAAKFPERLERLVLINAAHRSPLLASAWRLIQRKIVAFGEKSQSENETLALARALAICTYRGAAEFEERFTADPNIEPLAALDSYLSHQGEKIVDRLSASAYQLLSKSIDEHTQDFKEIATLSYLITTTNDQIVPANIVAEAKRDLHKLRRHFVLASKKGHDAFLTEPNQLAQYLDFIFE